MAVTKKFTFEDAKKLLLSKKINNSEIARLMYPTVKSSSASAKLKNKLDEKNRFRFTNDEQVRLVTIVKTQFAQIL